MNQKNYRLLIADDHTIIRRGLTMIIQNSFDIRFIYECEKSVDLIRTIKENLITHAIIDITFPDSPSTSYLPQIIEQFPRLKILIYTMHSSNLFEHFINQYPQILFCQKSEPEYQFQKILNSFFSNEIQTPIIFPERNKSSLTILSAMEESVLRLLLAGKTNKEISELLNIKSNTISTYKRRIMDKTEVQSIIELSKLF